MDMHSMKMGFDPVYDEYSELLILGSFPSVKSREISFSYGHKQNRFWKTVCGFFNKEIPETVEGKIRFLNEKHIALWDNVTECQIVGSADSSVKNEKIADLSLIFKRANIKKVLLNGSLAYELFFKYYAEYCEDNGITFIKMPSTSPANPRFSKSVWEAELYGL
jgi:hypoxanthine-DNA glycosylase